MEGRKKNTELDRGNEDWLWKEREKWEVGKRLSRGSSLRFASLSLVVIQWSREEQHNFSLTRQHSTTPPPLSLSLFYFEVRETVASLERLNRQIGLDPLFRRRGEGRTQGKKECETTQKTSQDTSNRIHENNNKRARKIWVIRGDLYPFYRTAETTTREERIDSI